jgi:hypothetical protein
MDGINWKTLSDRLRPEQRRAPGRPLVLELRPTRRTRRSQGAWAWVGGSSRTIKSRRRVIPASLRSNVCSSQAAAGVSSSAEADAAALPSKRYPPATSPPPDLVGLVLHHRRSFIRLPREKMRRDPSPRDDSGGVAGADVDCQHIRIISYSCESPTSSICIYGVLQSN